MDAIALAPECKVAGRDLELTGEILATTTHSLLMGLLAPLFTPFRYKYPSIVLDVAISNQLAKQRRHESNTKLTTWPKSASWMSSYILLVWMRQWQQHIHCTVSGWIHSTGHARMVTS
jgi:hypothetical protein